MDPVAHYFVILGRVGTLRIPRQGITRGVGHQGLVHLLHSFQACNLVSLA